VELFERIRIDHREEGVSIRALADRHRVHRRTVRHAIASAVPPPRKPVTRAAPAIGPQSSTIRTWLTDDLSAPRKQRHTARRVWQRLVDEQGALVAESTVRRHVRRIRAELESNTTLVTVPQTHPAGDEAEVDFGAASIWLAGVLTTVSIFSIVDSTKVVTFSASVTLNTIAGVNARPNCMRFFSCDSCASPRALRMKLRLSTRATIVMRGSEKKSATAGANSHAAQVKATANMKEMTPPKLIPPL